MNIQEMKSKIREYQKKYKTTPLRQWQFTNLANWEYMLLTEIGAIDNKGIVADYPVLRVKSDKDDYTIDKEGDMHRLIRAKEDFNNKNGKEKAMIVSVPRKYTIFRDALREMEEEKERIDFAFSQITPPPERIALN